jgi:hypothetical protein
MVLSIVAFAFLAFAMVGVGPLLPSAHNEPSAAHLPGRTP